MADLALDPGQRVLHLIGHGHRVGVRRLEDAETDAGLAVGAGDRVRRDGAQVHGPQLADRGRLAGGRSGGARGRARRSRSGARAGARGRADRDRRDLADVRDRPRHLDRDHRPVAADGADRLRRAGLLDRRHHLGGRQPARRQPGGVEDHVDLLGRRARDVGGRHPGQALQLGQRDRAQLRRQVRLLLVGGDRVLQDRQRVRREGLDGRRLGRLGQGGADAVDRLHDVLARGPRVRAVLQLDDDERGALAGDGRDGVHAVEALHRVRHGHRDVAVDGVRRRARLRRDQDERRQRDVGQEVLRDPGGREGAGPEQEHDGQEHDGAQAE